jgi:hypothetical protein
MLEMRIGKRGEFSLMYLCSVVYALVYNLNMNLEHGVYIIKLHRIKSKNGSAKVGKETPITDRKKMTILTRSSRPWSARTTAGGSRSWASCTPRTSTCPPHFIKLKGNTAMGTCPLGALVNFPED